MSNNVKPDCPHFEYGYLCANHYTKHPACKDNDCVYKKLDAAYKQIEHLEKLLQME